MIQTSSTSPSLETVIRITSPTILSFLSPKDILCSLQYVSRDIGHLCSTTSEIWTDFATRYDLGKIMLKEDFVDLYPLYPIILSQSDLIPLDHVPNEILFSIITGIISPNYVGNDLDRRILDEFYSTYFKSPFNWSISFNYNEIAPKTTHLTLYYTGEWGIFWRSRFSDCLDEEDSDYEDYENNDFTIQDFGYKRLHNEVLKIGVEFHGSSSKHVFKSHIRINKCFDEYSEGNGVKDMIFGAIDVSNKSYDPENPDNYRRFKRLSHPIKIDATFYPKEPTNRRCDQFFFAYLWPLTGRNNELLFPEPHYILHSSNNSTTTVKVQVIGDLDTIYHV